MNEPADGGGSAPPALLPHGITPVMAQHLEAAVETRSEPVRVEEVLAALRGKLDPAPKIAGATDFYRHHPRLACLEDRVHSPRSLAARTRFVVRLLPWERAHGVLIPGSRFLPFVAFDRPAEDLVLEDGQGVPFPRTPVRAPREVVLQCVRLLGPQAVRAALDGVAPGDESVACEAVRLAPAGTAAEQVPREWQVACVDYDAGRYRIEPLGAVAAEARQADAALLNQVCVRVLESPPPGPRFAARQLLHFVVKLMDHRLAAPVVGPLGAILAENPLVELEEGNDAFLFRLGLPPTSAPSPGATAVDPAALLPGLLEATAHFSGETLAEAADLRACDPVWNGAERRFDVPVLEGSGRRVLRVEVTAGGRMRPGPCTCPDGQAAGRCRHQAAALQALVGPLRDPDSSLSRRVADSASPVREAHALDAVDAVLDAGGAGEQRLGWRLRIDAAGARLVPVLQRRAAGGGWSPGREHALDAVARSAEPWATQADRRSAAALLARTNDTPAAESAEAPQDPGQVAKALDCLVRSGRVFWADAPESAVRIERARLRLRVDRDSGGLVRIRAAAAALVDGPAVVTLRGEERWLLADRSLGRVVVASASPMAFSAAEALIGDGRPLVPAVFDGLLARYSTLHEELTLDLPPDLPGEEVTPGARHVLRLVPLRPAGVRARLCVQPLPAPDCVHPPGEGPREPRARVGGRHVFARRDLVAEAKRADDLAAALGLDAARAAGPFDWLLESDEEALDLLAAAARREGEGLAVEWPEGMAGVPRRRPCPDRALKVSLLGDADQLLVQGELDVGGGVRLALGALLEALRLGRRWLRLPAGDFLEIPGPLLDRLRALAAAVRAESGLLRIDPAAVPAVAELLDEAAAERSRAWREALERHARNLTRVPELPPGFSAELRDYQREGFAWLSRMAAWGAGVCLADDMGLGKTVQTLAVLAERAPGGPALVVCPASVEANWEREVRRFAPALRPRLHRDGDRLADAGALGAGDVVILSYGLLRQDQKKLATMHWHTAVFDEAHALKNDEALVAQAARAVPADWRLALTGTPMLNRLSELWGLFRLLCPALLGGRAAFEERFVLPVEGARNQDRLEVLSQLTRPFLLRRSKEKVLKDLPQRSDVLHRVEPGPEERKAYAAGRLAAQVDLDALEPGELRRRLFKEIATLRQLACHPRILDPKFPADSAKLRVLREMLQELIVAGHRALVVSSFLRFLELVRTDLEFNGLRTLMLSGEVPARERQEIVDAFQGGAADALLMTFQTGGVGLNLTAADYVILLDPFWNSAVEDQAAGRAHRIGQERPVVVVRLVTAATIEEGMLAMQERKRDVIAGVLAGSEAAAKLTTEEMLELVRSGAREGG